MVILKSHKAFGSFLGRGTHVWLEIHSAEGKKVTFSGAKLNGKLGIVENLKKDYDKPATRGSVVIRPPKGIAESDWAKHIIDVARNLKLEQHKVLRYDGLFPFLTGRGNCCTVVMDIIHRAGGCLPVFRPKGIAPGLGCSSAPA